MSSFAGVHTALGDKNRAQHPWRLAGRLPPHSSSVPQVNRPAGATAHGAAPRIATVAAALLLDRVISSIPSLHLTDESTQRHGRDAAGCSPKAASAIGNGPWRTVYSRARGTGAAAGQDGAARWSNPCVVACCCAHGARRYVARSMHNGSGVAYRCTTRLSVPRVNGPGGASAHGVAARNATVTAPQHHK